jgi:hypothetical protein
MFSFLKEKPKEEQTMCVLVVSSYSVIAAVVRMYYREDAVTKPVVLFSYEEKVPHYHMGGWNNLESLVAVSTKKVLEKCRMIHGNYDRIVCALGEPWVMTKTRHITLEKPTQFKLTQKIINDAVARDSRLFEQEAVRDYAKNEEWGIIHTTRPTVEVNGYQTENFIGAITKNAMIHVSISLAPASFVELIMGAYADVFHRVDISFIGTETLVAQLVKHYAHAAVITLGGNSGTLAVFNKGNLDFSEKIHRGLADFESRVAYLFNVNKSHIGSVVKFASDEKLLEHERDVYYQRIEAAYKSIGDELRMGILRLKKYAGHITEPVFLVANPHWISIIKSLVEKDIESSVTIPHHDMFNEVLVYTHEARVKNVLLSLAVLEALKK